LQKFEKLGIGDRQLAALDIGELANTRITRDMPGKKQEELP
jgi:hypothetical protein